MVNPPSFVTIELGVFVNQNSRNTRRSHRLPKVMLKKELLGIVLVTFNFQILSLFFNDTDDYKFDRHIAALIEMEDAKKLVTTMENQGDITLLNDIDALSTNYTIKVKIVSLWRKKMRGNERETYRIDMILMDEMGTKIQAFCLHKLFPKFERHLNVDECLIIKRPSLAANTASFKIVPNNQKLSFYYHTFVEKCSKWEGPQYIFNFVDFDDVVSQRIKEGTTISLVTLLFVIRLRTLTKRMVVNGNVSILSFKISNVHIDLTLWDDYAKDMYSYMVSKNREAHVVVAVHFGAVKTYKGKWGISNNFDGSRLFIDSNFDEMLSFKEKFLSKLAASTESSSHAGSYMMCSVEDEFLNNDVFFSPIAYLGSIIEPKKVVIIGTIVAIVYDRMWY
ncbi:putative nucleic acid-binding protein [Helianthus debilis subsp. tardiflorus]